MSELPHNPGHAPAAAADELVLSKLDELPAPAPIALELLHAVSHTRPSAGDIAKRLRGDQSLCRRLTAMASAAVAGGGRQVTDVEQAVGILGFGAMRGVVLTLKLLECFPPERSGPIGRALNRLDFWRHSIGVACAARRLAAQKPAWAIDPDDAYVAGLLHDIGKVALDAVFPKAYERIVATARDHGADLLETERAVLFTTHTAAGRRIALRWRLPPPLVDVIWLHHLSPAGVPYENPHHALIGLIRLADALARENHIGDSGNPRCEARVAEIGDELGCAAEQVASVGSALAGDVDDQCRVLGLDHGASESGFIRGLNQARGDLQRANGELDSENRKLSQAARYLASLAAATQTISQSVELRSVALALHTAAALLWPQQVAAVFVLHDPPELLELCRSGADATAFAISPNARSCLETAGATGNGALQQTPRALRELADLHTLPAAEAACWLPIAMEGRVRGGIVFAANAHFERALAEEREPLSAWGSQFAALISAAAALSAARRLSDDLADTNRRLQERQSEYLRNRSLTVVAELAAGAGHELNNPLSVISGRAQLLLRDLPAGSEMYNAIEQIHAKAHDCSRIVSELMEFARPQPPVFQNIPAAKFMSDFQTEWAQSAPAAKNRVQFTTGPDQTRAGVTSERSAEMRVDPTHLKAVIGELIENAVTAMGERPGLVRVGWRLVRPVATRTPSQSTAVPAIEFTVVDNGAGMPAAVLQRAFDPFFSHRSAGRRRGLGLARAFRVIDAMDGRIWLESRPGAGTTAHVLLPQVFSGIA
ncbi:MAG: HDOD domain-containing protein [Planctomycetes bacterium]|nr:HDOD domain-containing protein [Planctomycetota bacterium]